MNPSPEIVAALDLIPGWDAQVCQIELLSGGLTNQTFLVDTGNSRAVLRLTSGAADPLAPTRTHELAVLRNAAAAGIAPATIYSNVEEGVLVTEYLEGRSWTAADLADQDKLTRLAELLRVVHELPTCDLSLDESSSDLSAAADRYAIYLDRRGERTEFAAKCVGIVKRTPCSAIVRCCHNDVVAGNVIDGIELRLVDWEFAGNNNPFFDLASLIGYHDLDATRAETLLQSYSMGATAENREQLTEQTRIFDAIQWLWLACRNLSAPSKDFPKRLVQLEERIS